MNNRIITIIAGLIILAIGFGGKKFLASKAKAPERIEAGSDIPVLLTRKVQLATIPNKIEITGKLVASKRIELFSEVQGVLLQSSKEFKAGEAFTKGQRLLRIDSTEFYLNLMASKSNYLNALIQLGPDIKYDYPDAYKNWMDYVSSIDINNAIPALPSNIDEKQRNFLTAKNVYNQYYQLKSQEEKLSKYNLEAPFNGVLSEGNLQRGTMIRAGQKLGTFIQPGLYELEANINVSQVSSIRVGDTVQLKSQDVAGSWTGRIIRISQSIDKTTQTVKIYIAVSDASLREGMYLSGNIISKGFEDAVEIPRSHLMGTHHVFVVKDSILTLTPIEVKQVGKNVVVATGLNNNDVLLNQVYSGAYNGLKISAKTESK